MAGLYTMVWGKSKDMTTSSTKIPTIEEGRAIGDQELPTGNSTINQNDRHTSTGIGCINLNIFNVDPIYVNV